MPRLQFTAHHCIKGKKQEEAAIVSNYENGTQGQ